VSVIGEAGARSVAELGPVAPTSRLDLAAAAPAREVAYERCK